MLAQSVCFFMVVKAGVAVHKAHLSLSSLIPADDIVAGRRTASQDACSSRASDNSGGCGASDDASRFGASKDPRGGITSKDARGSSTSDNATGGRSASSDKNFRIRECATSCGGTSGNSGPLSPERVAKYLRSTGTLNRAESGKGRIFVHLASGEGVASGHRKQRLHKDLRSTGSLRSGVVGKGRGGGFLLLGLLLDRSSDLLLGRGVVLHLRGSSRGLHSVASVPHAIVVVGSGLCSRSHGRSREESYSLAGSLGRLFSSLV